MPVLITRTNPQLSFLFSGPRRSDHNVFATIGVQRFCNWVPWDSQSYIGADEIFHAKARRIMKPMGETYAQFVSICKRIWMPDDAAFPFKYRAVP